MDAPVVKTVMRRSEHFHDEMKPTIAASITAGPTLLAGSGAYIIAARKMKASAMDFSLWPTPSPLVTDTVKRLAARVKTNNPARGGSPAQPVSGKPVIETKERISSAEASVATQPRSARGFQLPCGIANMSSSQK